MNKLKSVKFIVVHCAANNPKYPCTVDDVRRWHVQDNGWDDIGYHFYIDHQGCVFNGRDSKYAGVHEPKANSSSIGVCLEGGYNGAVNYTEQQLHALRAHILDLREAYPMAAIVGHNQFRNDKSCPNFNVPFWWEDGEIVQTYKS